MFLLAAPPCSATCAGGSQHGSVGQRSDLACRPAAAAQRRAAIDHRQQRSCPSCTHLGVHDLGDAVHKLHHILLQHLSGVCTEGAGVHSSMTTSHLGNSGSSSGPHATQHRSRSHGLVQQCTRSHRSPAVNNRRAACMDRVPQHNRSKCPCPNTAAQKCRLMHAPVKERMSQKPKMAATLRPGTMGFRSPAGACVQKQGG